MADDNTVRSFRSIDPPRRAAEPARANEPSGGSDPLSELARLIGQSDPFGDFGSKATRSSERVASAASDWRKTAAAMPAYEPVHEDNANDSDAHFAPKAGYAEHERYQPAYDEEPRANADSNSPRDPRDDPHAFDRYPPDQMHAADRLGPRRDDALYGGAGHETTEGEPYFDDGAPMTPQDEQSYDDAPKLRRRSGLLTAVTLIACAMVGTAGAYGYRTYYTSSSSTKVPPVIPAEMTPSKIVPATDPQSSKAIQDRVGEQAAVERLMPGAEQPVDLKPPATQTGPRVVLPPLVQPLPNQTSAPQGLAAQGAPSGAPTPGGEPKRVRTVTIRPDGGDASSRTVGGAPTTAGQVPGKGPSARAALPPRSAPPAPRNNGGPISLDPQAQAYSAPAAPAPPPARERTAAATPITAPAPLAPPTPRASTGPALAAAPPAAAGGGGYLVQLSSQRSEAEAQSSFRALQGRFPHQLGGRAPIVKRADLGSKGTFYRAMVGPFGSSSEADQFCSSLKSAGGQCLIQRN
jgi:hypothetical protein